MMKFKLTALLLFISFTGFTQKAIDFGGGATINVGFQEEWGINLRGHYRYNENWSYLAEYNLFFRRDVTSQNTETFSEFGLGVNRYLFSLVGINISGGIGYTGNNFYVNKNELDTSNLFLTTGNFNHGAEIKFIGILPLGEHFRVFSELNLKSFGRRYDTFLFGVVYSISN